MASCSGGDGVCSAAGDQLLTTRPGDPAQVIVVDPDTGEVRGVTPEGMNAYEPSASADGDRLVWVNGIGTNESAGPRASVLWISDRDGGDAERVTGGARFSLKPEDHDSDWYDQQPEWSPVEDVIVYRHYDNTGGGMNLQLLEPGSEPRALTEARRDVQDTYPTWSPDGSEVAFVRRQGGDVALWVIQADGENERRLVDVGRFEDVVWTPDGNDLLVTGETIGDEGVERPLRRVDVATASVTAVGAATDGLAWSPDHQRLYAVGASRLGIPPSMKILTLEGDDLRAEEATLEAATAFTSHVSHHFAVLSCAH